MATIVYIQPDGTRREVESEEGATVMETAVDNDVEGIVAECGGGCSCGTCHVYVDETWAGRLTPPEQIETELLEFVIDRQATSRLSCQLEVDDALDGLVVKVPKSQY